MIIPTQNQRASNNTRDHLNVKQSMRNSIGRKKDHSLSLTNTTIKQKHSSRKQLHVKLQQNKIETRRLLVSQSSISSRHSTFHPCFQKRYQGQTKNSFLCHLFLSNLNFSTLFKHKQTSRPIICLITTRRDRVRAKVIPILFAGSVVSNFCCSQDDLLETYCINVI